MAHLLLKPADLMLQAVTLGHGLHEPLRLASSLFILFCLCVTVRVWRWGTAFCATAGNERV